jgi:DNA repair protein RAD57
MTDLLRVLPHFPVGDGQFARLIPALEKHGISASDLLTLEAADIGKRTHLPLLDIRRLCAAVLAALHTDLGVSDPPPRQNARGQPAAGPEAGPQSGGTARAAPEQPDSPPTPASTLRNTAASLSAQWQTISTLDPELDRALGGGIPAGYVTEVTGESGAGKTQFLLALLLSVQLPPPHGLGRPALYISTEAPLSTRRLTQMLSANPLYQRLPPSKRPSLDNVISTVTPDLESQDHILTFQVPVEVERRGIGLIVLDSVAANYRAEYERSTSSSGGRHGFNMGARTAELTKLGMHLRELAQKHNLAVVVSNQIADRFGGNSSGIGFTHSATPASSLRHHPYQSGPRQTQESPLAARSRPPPHITNKPAAPDPPSSLPHPPNSLPQPQPPLPQPRRPPHPQNPPNPHPALTLDHQQNWFTGWGANPHSSQPLKTPALGLVWTSQISARIALFRRPVYYSDYNTRQPGEAGASGWERWMEVVFAGHVSSSSSSGSGSGSGVGGLGWDGEGEGEGGDDGEMERGGRKVGFEVWMGGLRATNTVGVVEGRDGEDEEGVER